jgi:hypothetical protein
LYIGLSGEGKSSEGNNGQESSVAGSWSLKYLQSPTMAAALIQDIVTDSSGTKHTTSLAMDGKISPSFSYLLEWKKLQGQPQSDATRTLAGEITGGLAYRSANSNMNSWFVRYKSLLYANKPQSGATPPYTQVSVLAADLSHRLSANSILTATFAEKQTMEKAPNNSGATDCAADVRLTHVGLSLPVGGRYNLELFGRQVWDSLGQSVSGTAAEFMVPVAENLGVSLGVSTLGLDDPDLRSVVVWPKGVYTRLRAVF